MYVHVHVHVSTKEQKILDWSVWDGTAQQSISEFMGRYTMYVHLLAIA